MNSERSKGILNSDVFLIIGEFQLLQKKRNNPKKRNDEFLALLSFTLKQLKVRLLLHLRIGIFLLDQWFLTLLAQWTPKIQINLHRPLKYPYMSLMAPTLNQ